jgi:hypothetical protein
VGENPVFPPPVRGEEREGVKVRTSEYNDWIPASAGMTVRSLMDVLMESGNSPEDVHGIEGIKKKVYTTAHRGIPPHRKEI